MKKLLSLLMILCVMVALVAPSQVEAARLKLNKTIATMEVDSNLKLRLGKLSGIDSTWTSSDNKVVTVTKYGVITAKSEGSATITAIYNNRSYLCQVTVVDSNKEIVTSTIPEGSRTNPADGYDGLNVTLWDIFDTTQYNLFIKLNKFSEGEEANSIVAYENPYNKTPSSSQKWILMSFDVNYISSTTDEEFSTLYFMSDTDFFTDGGKNNIRIYDTATFYEDLSGLDLYRLTLYPGGKGTVCIGFLVDNTVDDISLRFGSDYKGTYWLKIK